jgi:PleD family two-component response regulator
MKYQILLLLKATSKWLGLSKAYRDRIFTEFVYPLFLRFTDDLKIQLFNSEAFHAGVSDIINIETEKIETYYRFVQELKSSKIFSEEYFELRDTVVGIENGFRKFNEELKKEKNYGMN